MTRFQPIGKNLLNHKSLYITFPQIRSKITISDDQMEIITFNSIPELLPPKISSVNRSITYESEAKEVLEDQEVTVMKKMKLKKKKKNFSLNPFKFMGDSFLSSVTGELSVFNKNFSTAISKADEVMMVANKGLRVAEERVRVANRGIKVAEEGVKVGDNIAFWSRGLVVTVAIIAGVHFVMSAAPPPPPRPNV